MQTAKKLKYNIRRINIIMSITTKGAVATVGASYNSTSAKIA